MHACWRGTMNHRTVAPRTGCRAWPHVESLRRRPSGRIPSRTSVRGRREWKLKREDAESRNHAGFLIFYTLAAGLGRIFFTRTGTLLARGRVGPRGAAEQVSPADFPVLHWQADVSWGPAATSDGRPRRSRRQGGTDAAYIGISLLAHTAHVRSVKWEPHMVSELLLFPLLCLLQSFLRTISKKIKKSKDWEHSYLWYPSDAHHARHTGILHRVWGLSYLKPPQSQSELQLTRVHADFCKARRAPDREKADCAVCFNDFHQTGCAAVPFIFLPSEFQWLPRHVCNLLYGTEMQFCRAILSEFRHTMCNVS